VGDRRICDLRSLPNPSPNGVNGDTSDTRRYWIASTTALAPPLIVAGRLLSISLVSGRTRELWIVSFTDSESIQHAVEVSASTP